MAYNRDRSGLVTRRRVIAYLERERRNKHPSNGSTPIVPADPNTADYRTFFMSGMMGSAPNRESLPETSLRPVFFMTGLMGVAPNRTVNSVI